MFDIRVPCAWSLARLDCESQNHPYLPNTLSITVKKVTSGDLSKFLIIATISIFPVSCELMFRRFLVAASSKIGSAHLTFQLGSIASISWISKLVSPLFAWGWGDRGAARESCCCRPVARMELLTMGGSGEDVSQLIDAQIPASLFHQQPPIWRNVCKRPNNTYWQLNVNDRHWRSSCFMSWVSSYAVAVRGSCDSCA